MITEILDEIIRQSEPVKMPGPWKFLPTSQNVRIVVQSAEEIMQNLESRFSGEQLVESKVYRRSHGHPMLSSFLTRGRPFIVLQDSHGSLTDIVNATGSLASRDPPLFECGCDFETCKGVQQSKSVYAATCSIDLGVLRLLELPVTSIARLAAITGRQARRFFKDGVGPRGRAQLRPEPTATSAANWQITIVGWHVFGISTDLPPYAMLVIQHLKRAAEQLEVDPDSFPLRVWRPSPDHLENIRGAVRLREGWLVRKRFSESLTSSTLSVEDFLQQSATENVSFFEAHRALQDVLSKSRDFPSSAHSVSQRVAVYENAFRNAVMSPLIQQIDSDPDPRRRVLHLLCADLAQSLHEESSLMEQARLAADGRANGRAPLSTAEETDSRLGRYKQFAWLVRQIIEGKK